MGLLDRFDGISPLSKNFYGGAAGQNNRRTAEAYRSATTGLRRQRRRGGSRKDRTNAALQEIAVRQQATRDGFTPSGISSSDANLARARKAQSDLHDTAAARNEAVSIQGQQNEEERANLAGGSAPARSGALGAGSAGSGLRTSRGLGGGGIAAQNEAGIGTGTSDRSTVGRNTVLSDSELATLRGPNAPGQPSTPGLDRQDAQGIGGRSLSPSTTPSTPAPQHEAPSGFLGARGSAPGSLSSILNRNPVPFGPADTTPATPLSGSVTGGEPAESTPAADSGEDGGFLSPLREAFERGRAALRPVREAFGSRRAAGERLLEEQHQQDALLKEGATAAAEEDFQNNLLKEGELAAKIEEAPVAARVQEVGAFEPFTGAAIGTQRSGTLSREDGRSYAEQQKFFNNSAKALGKDLKSPGFRVAREAVKKAMLRREINPRYAAQYLADVAEVFKTYERLKKVGLARGLASPPGERAMRENPRALFDWVSQVNEVAR